MGKLPHASHRKKWDTTHMEDSELQRRLRARMAATGHNQKSLAVAAGLNDTAVRDILKGRSRNPQYRTLYRLAEILGCQVADLTGAGPADNPEAGGRLTVAGEDYVAVPVYDARASAGPGALNVDNPQPLHHHMFRHQWLSTLSISGAAGLSVLRVTGDSMWETLHDGDHVLVDTGVNQARRDGLFVIAWGDELMVKRVSVDPRNGLLTVASDNERYQTYTDVNPDEIRVIGRVLWLGRNIG